MPFHMQQMGICESFKVSKYDSFKDYEDVEQWACSYLVVGIHFGAVTLEPNAVLHEME